MSDRVVFDITSQEETRVALTAAEEQQRAAEEAAAAAEAAAQAILAANESKLRTDLLAGLAVLDGHLTTLAGTPTAAQQKAALVFTLKAVKQLARLVLRKLDATD